MFPVSRRVQLKFILSGNAILINLHAKGTNIGQFSLLSYLVLQRGRCMNSILLRFAHHKTQGTRRLYTSSSIVKALIVV